MGSESRVNVDTQASQVEFSGVPVLCPRGTCSETTWEDVPLLQRSHGSIITEGETERLPRGATSPPSKKGGRL